MSQRYSPGSLRSLSYFSTGCSELEMSRKLSSAILCFARRVIITARRSNINDVNAANHLTHRCANIYPRRTRDSITEGRDNAISGQCRWLHVFDSQFGQISLIGSSYRQKAYQLSRKQEVNQAMPADCDLKITNMNTSIGSSAAGAVLVFPRIAVLN
jgi:hypothetical protein